MVFESAKLSAKTADHLPDKNKEEKQPLIKLGVNTCEILMEAMLMARSRYHELPQT